MGQFQLTQVQKNSAKILKVDFPSEGGVFTHLENCPYPFPGFPHQEIVGFLGFAKDLFSVSVDGFNRALKEGGSSLHLIRIFLGTIKDIIKILFSGFLWYIKLGRKNPKRVLSKGLNMPEEKYCKMAREARRIFNLLAEREISPRYSERWKKIGDIISFILEYDNAWRFRIQDVLSELNLDEIKPTEGDKYYMSLNESYNWKGKSKKK